MLREVADNLSAGSVTVSTAGNQPGSGGANPTPALQFDSAWRGISRIYPCSTREVRNLIAARYLRKRPAIVVLCLKMEVMNMLAGMVIYSIPPREIEKRYGGKTWELGRLYISDSVPRNAETWLIAQGTRHIKKNFPDVKFLVSYADPSVGHSGTIYKAANWRIDGKTDEGRKTPRSDYVDSRTGKKYGRRGNVPADAVLVRRPRISKFRFVFSL